jgi:hypothetical protein
VIMAAAYLPELHKIIVADSNDLSASGITEF